MNTLRCQEYDRVARSLPTPDMPHVALMRFVFEHDDLTHLDWRHFVEVTAPENNPRRLLASRELSSLGKHMEQFYDTLLRTFRVDDSDTTEDPIIVQIEKMAERLTRYPLSYRLDAAFSAVDRTFMHKVAIEAGKDFVREISLFDSGDGALHLPILLVKHQTGKLDLDVVTCNMLHVCCVSAAHFLAVLGIKDFPVFGLATAGHYGYVSAAWYSETYGVRTDVHNSGAVSDPIRRCSTSQIATLPSTALTSPPKKVSSGSSAFWPDCRDMHLS